MLLLILNNVIIDPSKEWELFSKSGFIVDVIFNGVRPKLAPRRMTNITEFHWRYEEDKSVAIESDIDSSGQTLEIDWLQIVCVKGKVDLTTPMEDLVETWHAGASELPLHEFLGVSLADYGKWIEMLEKAGVE